MHRAALFDMDGLLIDSERVIMQTWQAVAAAQGVPLAAVDYLACIGRARPESEAILVAAVGGHDAYRQARVAVDAALARTKAEGGFPLKPGARELLDALAERGVPCAVASSSALPEIEERLAAVGVLGHFAAVAGGNEVPRGKPDPAIYRLAARRIGCQPRDCLVFEDSGNGVRAALAAEARVVMVPDLVAPTAELGAAVFRVLDSLHAVLPHLSDWFVDARPD